MYVDKLDEIVDKYINLHHKKIKLKPAGVRSGNLLGMMLSIMKKTLIQNWWSCENIKIPTFFCKRLHTKLIWGNFCDQKSKKLLYHGHMLFVILMVKKLLKHLMKKRSQKELRIEKITRETVIDCTSNRRTLII